MIGMASLLAATLTFQAQSTAPKGWIEIRTKDGQYQFAMPAKPKERTSMQVTPYAGKSPASEYLCISDDFEYGFQVMKTNVKVPSGQKEKALDDLVRGDPGTKILSKKAIDFEGHPGRECVLEAPTSPRGPSAKMVWRLYLIGDDVIQMTAQARKPGVEPKNTEAYFKSFGRSASGSKKD